MIIGIVKEAVHKKGQIDQKCAINCDIKVNVSNETFTKYRNMFVVKSISAVTPQNDTTVVEVTFQETKKTKLPDNEGFSHCETKIRKLYF